jgi:hypothetical protein
LHPIRDRAEIAKLMPTVLRLAKDLKQKCPRVKYRNMQVTRVDGTKVTITGSFTIAGPTMLGLDLAKWKTIVDYYACTG